MAKKYYWLKLRRDFFKRHDIALMRAQENGDAIAFFYLSLLAESIDHDGYLRYSDDVPYSEDELSTVTLTLQNVTAPAIAYFKAKKLMIIEPDGTIYMPKAAELIGSESDSAERVRRYRVKNYATCNADVTKCNADVTKCNTELEKEIELDIDKEKEKGKKPQKHKHGEYKHVLLTDEEYEKLNEKLKDREEVIKRLDEGIEMKGYKYKNHYLTILKWAEKDGLKQPKKMTEKDYAEGWE